MHREGGFFLEIRWSTALSRSHRAMRSFGESSGTRLLWSSGRMIHLGYRFTKDGWFNRFRSWHLKKKMGHPRPLILFGLRGFARMWKNASAMGGQEQLQLTMPWAYVFFENCPCGSPLPLPAYHLEFKFLPFWRVFFRFLVPTFWRLVPLKHPCFFFRPT